MTSFRKVEIFDLRVILNAGNFMTKRTIYKQMNKMKWNEAQHKPFASSIIHPMELICINYFMCLVLCMKSRVTRKQ